MNDWAPLNHSTASRNINTTCAGVSSKTVREVGEWGGSGKEWNMGLRVLVEQTEYGRIGYF